METTATLNNSYHSQYKQALIDPTELSEDELLGLLIRYPYSQPLIFAYERRKKLLKQESSNKELALLYAHSESWLMNYVNKPLSVDNIQTEPKLDFVDQVEESTINQEIPENQQETYEEEVLDFKSENEFTHIELNETESSNSIVDLDEQHTESASVVAEESVTVESEVEEIAPIPEHFVDVDNLEVDETLELDRLVHEGGIAGDYFAFDSFVNEDQAIEQQSTALEPTGEQEDMSLYNDDLMPYSFRWWLHKTRLEFADTYQPYATSSSVMPVSKSSIDFSIIEEAVLDQQIKENIINFQNPEEKLSDEVKKKPIIPQPPKKGSEIIEKFILKDPIIQPPSPENINNENMARQSAEDNYVFVTETLANIYIDQALYLKAIEVFRKLILKYPEKKSYFATRIEKLEKNL